MIFKGKMVQNSHYKLISKIVKVSDFQQISQNHVVKYFLTLRLKFLKIIISNLSVFKSINLKINFF